MLSDAELKELLAQKTETRNLDCKTSFSWDTADHDAKCELIKGILAFLNTQDGGQIVVGVQDDTLEPIGMAEADFSSFDTTKVNDFVHRYTDPQSSCEVQKLSVSGLKFVVINVLEFKDIPIICKKAANSSKDSSKTILKLGGVYIRTEKATSVLVPTSEELCWTFQRKRARHGPLKLCATLLIIRATGRYQRSVSWSASLGEKKCPNVLVHGWDMRLGSKITFCHAGVDMS